MIRFGTDGWRAPIGDGFDLPTVRKIAWAFAKYLKETQGDAQPVVIGYDTRFLGRESAQAISAILTHEGIPVILSTGWVPTPVLSYGVVHFKAGFGVMITASHNPAIYNGIKFKESYGGTGRKELYDALERVIAEEERDHPAKPNKKFLEVHTLLPSYWDYLRKIIPPEAVASSAEGVVWDAMHGATDGLFSRYFAPFAKVHTLRKYPDPRFGGIDPEPIPRNLGALKARVKKLRAPLGFAADGDGDRLGTILPDGTFITPHEVFALIAWHLLETKGKAPGIARTFSSSLYLDRIAERYHVSLIETGIGFKFLCPLLIQGSVLMAGEESGGLAFSYGLPERDSQCTALHLLKVLIKRNQSLSEALRALRDAFGPLYYARKDLPLQNLEKGKRLYQQLLANPPKKLGRWKVDRVVKKDGVKLSFGKEGWILFRVSGTEPLLRIYAELPDQKELSKLFDAALQWIAL